MDIDKLSATDRVFLDIEGGAIMMHIGAVIVFEGGDLVTPDGSLDAARVIRRLGANLGAAPRFRQIVKEVPGLGAVWVDDARFRIERHVHHTAVPRPGTEAQLMALAGRVFSQPLDRRRPLWEAWLVEGLTDGRFALILKTHHAMTDGVAGLGLVASLLRTEPDESPTTVPDAWSPHPAPGTLALAAALVEDSARSIAGAIREVRHSWADHGASHAKDIVAGLVETVREGTTPAAATSINPPELGAHREFLGVRLDLARAKSIRRALGGTVNDVALCAMTGALRRHLTRRGDAVESLHDFRALVPVNLRALHDVPGASQGNHISLMLTPLPLALADARERFAAVHAACERLKHDSHEIEGGEFVERVGDLGGPNVVTAVFRTASMLRAFNVTVTNVPGPQFPLYLGRSRMESIHGLVPLFTHQGVSVAIVSYDGGLFFGLLSDPDAVPDLDSLARDLRDSFDELAHAAGC
jgi:WS/DGAT/MGAT family acyltransferase